MLDQGEVDNLFRVIRDLTAEGVAVVYISHRLEEIRQIGDRITVLKDGRTVATGPPGQGHPDRRADPADDRPLDRVRLPAAPRASDVGAASRCWRSTTWSWPASSPASTSPCGRARSSGSPGWSAPGARRSSRRCTAPAGRRPARSRSTAGGCAGARCRDAVRAGVGLAPEERKSQGLLLDQAVYRNITVSSLERFSRLGMLDSRAERREAPARSPPRLDVRPAGVARLVRAAVGRQPAEGRAGPVAAARLPGAPARRADPRRRRRRPHRDLRPHPLPGRPRRRRRGRVQRGRGGARPRRPGAGRPRGSRRPRGPGRARSTSHRSSTSSWKEGSHERAEHQAGHRAPRSSPAGTPRSRRAVPAGRGGSGAHTASRAVLQRQRRSQPRAGRGAGADLPRRRRSPPATGSPSIDNVLTILRLAATIGVVSIGMTFVITGGGIDLSVGAILALSSVWCTTFATQDDGRGHALGGCHGLRRAGRRRRLRARQRAAHRLRQRRPLHRDAGDAGQLPAGWPRSSPSGRPRSSGSTGSSTSSTPTSPGIPVIVIIFALVAVVGWVLLNRTTFGRRTLAVGRQPRGGAAGRHQRQAAHRLLYVLRRRLLRHRRPDAGGLAHQHRQLDPRHPLRAGRDRRGRHRRHAALRWPRHHRRHRPRRADLHDPRPTSSPSTTRTRPPRPSPRA